VPDRTGPGVDLGRASDLLAWLARAAGLDPSAPEANALQRTLLRRYRVDHPHFSDVLEPSFCCDDEGAQLYRFSYAFPGVRVDADGVATTLLELCRPFGAHVEGACRTLLRALRSRAVAQPLFGFARDGADRFRVKLYLQFHATEAEAARELAGHVLGRPLPRDLAGGAPLHLLGLDLGADGLAGAKLYFMLDRVRLDDFPTRIGPVPLVAALSELGVSELRDVLTIHRIEGRDDDALARPAEVDFSLVDNALRWSDVRALQPVREHLDRSPVLAELESTFPLRMRRVSASVVGGGGAADKLNVYYVLADS